MFPLIRSAARSFWKLAHRRWFSVYVLAAFVVSLAAGAVPAWAAIQLAAGSPECVLWTSQRLQSALRSNGISPDSAQIQLVLSASGGNPKLNDLSRQAQSFSIEKNGTQVTIRARGWLGAMYGLDHVIDAVHAAPHASSWSQIADSMESVSRTPFVAIRADNMFIHLEPSNLTHLKMWQAYLDMLSRDRYDMLDLQGGYDLYTTSFPNLLPLLIHVPAYPGVGNPWLEAQNLSALKSIVAYARSRGVMVSLMNYSANNGLGGAYKNQASVTGVSVSQLPDYTTQAVARLIEQVPDLHMIGFRIGESGQSASFYQKVYPRALALAGRHDLPLYTRTWKTTMAGIEQLAHSSPAGLIIEIKYNGEQLGLPYQALEGAQFGSYSYQSYLDLPAPYRIIWQVRANGTNRFWAWENTNFIRRTVRTFTLGHALGFTLESPMAYFEANPAAYYSSRGDQMVYQWIWQKWWMWFYAWGRISYNPNLPTGAIVRAFARHYGSAGPAIYRAMQTASEIVPFACAYRFLGPDQRNFSPETETGEFYTGKRVRRDLLQFAYNRPEDSRSFVGIHRFVEEKIAGTPDGRIGPFQMAQIFENAARSTRSQVAAVGSLSGPAAGKWRLLRTDLLSASWLGSYYAHRILGLTWLEHAILADRYDEYQTAVRELQASRQAWGHLSTVADAVYGPLQNPLNRQTNFRWSSQISLLRQSDAEAYGFWHYRTNKVNMLPSLVLNATDRGLDAGLAVQRLSAQRPKEGTDWNISCRVAAAHGIRQVILWYKPLPSQAAWLSIPMQPASGMQTARAGASVIYSASVPVTPKGLLYQVEVVDQLGDARNFPDALNATPYRVIPPFPSVAQGGNQSASALFAPGIGHNLAQHNAAGAGPHMLPAETRR